MLTVPSEQGEHQAPVFGKWGSSLGTIPAHTSADSFTLNRRENCLWGTILAPFSVSVLCSEKVRLETGSILCISKVLAQSKIPKSFVVKSPMWSGNILSHDESHQHLPPPCHAPEKGLRNLNFPRLPQKCSSGLQDNTQLPFPSAFYVLCFRDPHSPLSSWLWFSSCTGKCTELTDS